jgi:DNA repair exonuclease SbcCD ATPase subunit
MGSDNSARWLLGESFKQQLKYDGTYSGVTFICSKTDDISFTESSRRKDITEEEQTAWTEFNEVRKELQALDKAKDELEAAKNDCADKLTDADDEIEELEALKDDLENGKEVRAPSDQSKKRKRSARSPKSRKKSKGLMPGGDHSIDDIDSEGSMASYEEGDHGSDKGPLLTAEAIEEKLSKLRRDKRDIRNDRSELGAKIKSLVEDISRLKTAKETMQDAIYAMAVKSRNESSKDAIQWDFGWGVRDLDMEIGDEEDRYNFDPEVLIRDYEQVARSLPVRCLPA